MNWQEDILGAFSPAMERLGIYFFVFSLFFSNLLGRISGVNVNILLYVFYALVLFIVLVRFKVNITSVFIVFIALFFALFTLDYRYPLKENVLSLKDVVIPLLCFVIGSALARHESRFINFLNVIFFPFVCYGVLQEAAFYSGKLAAFLPWDAEWITERMANGYHNLYQGPLLRFFGVMNAFVEYQVCVALVFAFLWLNLENLRRRSLFLINGLLAVIFLLLAVERSPILMLLILLLVWKVRDLLKNPSTLALKVVPAAMILVLSIHFGAGRLRHNYLIGNAFERLDNAVTLNFSKDEAIMERETVQWPEATSLASRNYFGIGPGRVTPSASQAVNYVAPHNNYMFYYLGYGFPGLALFLLMLVLILIQLSRMCHSRKYFGYGMVASYCAMAVFNLPFLGKIGMWFFLVAGFLLNSHENQAGQT